MSSAAIPDVFLNIATIAVLFLAWLVVIVSFFVLAIQLFVTLIEFKLTTLAGFVLVPFALWNRTAFLAERVLGNVVSAGVRSGPGGDRRHRRRHIHELPIAVGTEPSVDQALAIVLASLTLMGLGIFGPGIATGLVSGGPQLGAGAAVGTMVGAAGLAVAAGAAVGGAARLGGARRRGLALRQHARWQRAPRALRRCGRAHGASGCFAATQPRTLVVASGAAAGVRHACEWSAAQWAQRLHRRSQLTHGIATAAHAVRSSDHGGGGASPNLRQGGLT